MNVLSLFDGMSCGRIALERAGMPVTNYFASEIDKHAIKVSCTKWPDIVHLGDVTKVSAKDLPKIDMLIGGSPCQGFSFAGKGLNFNDPRSALFFEYVRILQECRENNPNVLFLLENVRMKKEHEDVISRILEIQPININSALVSAQNRERLYWTNIAMGQHGLFGDYYCTILPPQDKGLLIKDIVEEEVDEKYYLSEAMTKRLLSNIRGIDEKAGCLTGGGNSGGLHSDTTVIACRSTGRHLVNGKRVDIKGAKTEQYLEVNENHEKSNTLTSVEKDNLLVVGSRIGGVDITDRGIRPHRGDKKKSGISELGTVLFDDAKSDTITTNHSPLILQLQRGNNKGGFVGKDGKSPTVSSCSWEHNNLLVERKYRIRRLTPIECSRLQTVPDDYFYQNGQPIVSETQIYKMLGNGWTVDVIVHILNHIK